MLGARLVNNTIKLVQIRVKVMHYCAGSGCENGGSISQIRQKGQLTVHSNPLHDVDVLGQHHDRLDIAHYEGSVGEGAAKVQRLRSTPQPVPVRAVVGTPGRWGLRGRIRRVLAGGRWGASSTRGTIATMIIDSV